MTRALLLAKLAKLDALAARPGSPAEGEVAAQKAAALREKHRDLLGPVPPPMFQQPVMVNRNGAVWFSVSVNGSATASTSFDSITIEFR